MLCLHSIRTVTRTVGNNIGTSVWPVLPEVHLCLFPHVCLIPYSKPVPSVCGDMATSSLPCSSVTQTSHVPSWKMMGKEPESNVGECPFLVSHSPRARAVVPSLWVVTPWQVADQISCMWDIYIIIHNNSITIMMSPHRSLLKGLTVGRLRPLGYGDVRVLLNHGNMCLQPFGY